MARASTGWKRSATNNTAADRVQREIDMMSKTMLSAALSLAFAGMVPAAGAMAAETGKGEPLVIQEQGSFAVGGTVTKTAGKLAGRNVRRCAPTPCREPLPENRSAAQATFDRRLQLEPICWHGSGGHAGCGRPCR